MYKYYHIKLMKEEKDWFGSKTGLDQTGQVWPQDRNSSVNQTTEQLKINQKINHTVTDALRTMTTGNYRNVS